MMITGFPAFDRTAQAASDLRAKLAEQGAQAATGQRAGGYAGLGADARRAIDLRSELSRHEELSRGIARGLARADLTQTVLTRLADIATEIVGRGNTLLGMDAGNADLLAQSARTALEEVGGLLNTRHEGEALFGGADLQADPVKGPIAQSGMYAQIRAAVLSLTPASGAAVLAATQAAAMDDSAAVSPFSDYANAAATAPAGSDPRRAVPVEQGVTVPIGLYANRNGAAAPSDTAAQTGSWSRDLIRGLAIIANLTSTQAKQGAAYTTLVQGALGALRSAVSGVTAEAGALGSNQARLSVAQRRHEEIGGQVERQLGEVEGIDLAEAITRAQATRTQLEASYRSLSMLGGMSLANFLR
jgi:flagellin-like hook-associated protein FlgL